MSIKFDQGPMAHMVELSGFPFQIIEYPFSLAGVPTQQARRQHQALSQRRG